MKRPALDSVLEALIDSITDSSRRTDPSSGTEVLVTSLEITIPLDSILTRSREGRPLLLAAPPFAAIRTGFDRPTRLAHLHVVLEEDE